MAEAVALVGPQHGAACTALNAINPFLREGQLERVYFKVRDVYISVPSFQYIGEDLIIAFKGNISMNALHLSPF